MCILLENRRHRRTATGDRDGILLIGVKYRLLSVQWYGWKTGSRVQQCAALPSFEGQQD